MDKLDSYTQMDVFVGTAAELVGAGLVVPSQLPDHPGPDEHDGNRRNLPRPVFFCHGVRVGYVRRIDIQADAEFWMRVECHYDGRYVVYKGLPHAERLRRRREVAERNRKELAKIRLRAADPAAPAAAAVAQARALNAGMSTTDFRERLADQFRRALLKLAAHAEGTEHLPESRILPHLVPHVTFRAVLPHLFEIEKIITASPVVSGGAPLATARADASFQRFLARQCIADDGTCGRRGD